MPFVGELRPFQIEAVERMLKRERILVGYEMGLGKLQPVDEPILTPFGWRKIGDIQIGDEVIGKDGKPTKIVGVFPQGVQEIVRVTMQDGTYANVGWDHLWEVVNPSSRKNGPWRIYTTKELSMGVSSSKSGTKRFNGGLQYANGNNKYQIPMLESVHYAPIVLPIDPYILGVLLGNGSFTLSRSRFYGFPETWDECQFKGWISSSPKTDEDCTGWYLDEPVIEKYINYWGLRGHRAWEKFVPEPYLLGTPEDRLFLLQGLMDTDGHAMQDGGAEFSSTSPHLMDAVAELTQSLGGIARGRRWAASTFTYKGKTRKGRPAERINIKLPPPLIPFFLSRKAECYVIPTKYPPNRAITSIEPIGKKEAVCIKVTNTDGLYVTRSFIVTHNSVISIYSAEHLLDEGVVDCGFIVCTNSLKYQWKRMLDQFTGGEAKVLIADGTPDHRRRVYNSYAAGEAEYLIINPDQVVNDWDIISKLSRGFIVADEIQFAKNFKPKRSRKIKKLNARYQWGLTGQPVENRAEEVFSIMQFIDPTVLGDFEHFDKAFINRDTWGTVRGYKNLPTLHMLLSEAMVRKTRDEVADQMPSIVEESLLIDLDISSAKLYRLITEELLEDLDEARVFGNFDIFKFYTGGDDSGGNKARGRIMSKLICLRMLCDHPDLLRISAEHFSGKRQSVRSGSAYAYDLMERGLLDRLNRHPKLDTTVEEIETILTADPKNKIVLFSYFTDMLDIIQTATTHLTKSVLFTGKIIAKRRDESKESFSTDPSVRLFLSSDAGGTGLDLPIANYLISCDLPWSAGAYAQRKARIDRLSSEFPQITLLSMLISGSIEERQYEMLEQKQKIGLAIVDGKGINKKGQLTLDLASLGSFLRSHTV